MRTQVLLYVNQVYPDDYTGQGTFERELIAALQERVGRQPTKLLRVFTVRLPGANVAEGQVVPDTVALLLDKRRARGYLAHQVRLSTVLVRALLRHWRDDVTVYARNAPSSVAPVALASLFRRRLVIRTGPTLANLVSFDKHPSPL